jgi:hypothetical protein
VWPFFDFQEALSAAILTFAVLRMCTCFSAQDQVSIVHQEDVLLWGAASSRGEKHCTRSMIGGEDAESGRRRCRRRLVYAAQGQRRGKIAWRWP